MTATNRLVASFVALAAAVALAGCSLIGTQDPIIEGRDDPTSSPTLTNKPPSPPELSETARQETVEGGVEFVEYYYNLIEYGHKTGKWEPLRKVTDSSCKECERFWSGPDFYKPDEDVVTEVQGADPSGIEDGALEVTTLLHVGVGLNDAESEIEMIELTKKQWQDDVMLAYDDGWRVVAIEPDQLLPYHGCIADRCTDAQKKRAEEGR